MVILASTVSDVLSYDAPVFGIPAAIAFIIWLVIDERIVPGRTYRRAMADNEALRKTVEKIVPLAQDMVEIVESTATTMERSTRVTEDCINALSGVHPVYKGPR